MEYALEIVAVGVAVFGGAGLLIVLMSVADWIDRRSR